jgi:hypothetical protein
MNPNPYPDIVGDLAADRLTLQAGSIEAATTSAVEVARAVETPAPGKDRDGSNWTRACRALKLPQ